MSKQLQHVVFQNRYPKRRLSVIHDHKDYAIDQHAFQLATRWHCIKNKLCHHVTVTNNTPSLYSKQSSLLSFLCSALQWQSVRRASPCTSSQVVKRVHFVADHRQKYYHRNSRDVGDRGEESNCFQIIKAKALSRQVLPNQSGANVKSKFQCSVAMLK